MRPTAYLWTLAVALLWFSLLPGQVFAGLTLKHSHAGYPVSGAFAYVDKAEPAMAGQACKVFARFGLKKLSGNTIGELIVFDNKRRLDFGGYADTESQNISVRQTTDREFDIVDQSYDDGEGGHNFFASSVQSLFSAFTQLRLGWKIDRGEGSQVSNAAHEGCQNDFVSHGSRQLDNRC